MATRSSSLEVLAFAGSLRRASYNRALLRSAQELAPDGMRITIHELDDIPVYNQDVEEEGDPQPVTAFKDAVRRADALVIATPEYQHGIPGVLKNALDWTSRPSDDSALSAKPVAVMGASPGVLGTARAQTQLRQTLTYNASHVLPPPEVVIGEASDRFDGDGNLTDDASRKFVAEALERLVAWTRLVGGQRL